MTEIDIAVIKQKSLHGILTLTSRTFLLQIVAFGATFLLTIFLEPEIFGIFYVVSALISFLGYFSDIGLAAALIQKKEQITKDDLKTTFSLQQSLVIIICLIALLFSSAITNYYKLNYQGLLLFRTLIFSFFLSSLKTIPSVLLERALDFNKLVIPQILETTGFYAIAVFLAWQGFGISSFTWAVLVRGIVGLLSIYWLSPWKISIGFSKPALSKLLKFGAPFQLNSFLALIKDDLLTVFLGKVLPFWQVGYIGWAKKWAEVPLRLIMDSVIKVSFPAFSRIQHSRVLMGKAIDKTLTGLSLTILPVTVGLIFFIEPLVKIIPKYSKWEPALFSFYLFALASVVAGLTTPLTNALNAIGKIKITLLLMIMWTIFTWVLTVLFINLYGFNGVAVGLFVLSTSIILVNWLVKQIAPYSFFSSVQLSLVGVIFQSFWYYFALSIFGHSFINLLFVGLFGIAFYAFIIYKVGRKEIVELVKMFRN